MLQDDTMHLPRRNGGMTGSTLKWLAIIFMLIDHVAAVLLIGMFKQHNGWGSGIGSREFYFVMRSIGRIAFPIFCFLLAEGFLHTRNKWKYLLRLSVFALISEVPFDLAFSGVLCDFSHQNVFFTLSLGLLAVIVYETLAKSDEPEQKSKQAFAITGSILCAFVALVLRTDYDAMGVLMVLVLYWTRNDNAKRDIAAIVVLLLMIPCGAHWIEVFGALAIPLFHLYNGQRGKQNKYFFYVFYPAHLILLALINKYLLVKK